MRFRTRSGGKQILSFEHMHYIHPSSGYACFGVCIKCSKSGHLGMADNFQRAQVLYNTYILGQVHTSSLAIEQTVQEKLPNKIGVIST